MINIIIGSVADDNRTIHKTFNERATITGEINFPCDILNPELIVSRDIVFNSDNYCYIPYFNRYYFIGDIIYNGKTKTLPLSVDVLKTYAEPLQNCECVVTRSEIGTNYIVDDKLPINSNKYYLEGKYFPNNPFTGNQIISDNIILSVITQGGVF